MRLSPFYRHIAPLERREETERRSPFPTNYRRWIVGVGQVENPDLSGSPTYGCVYGLRHQVTAHGVCLLL